jgi:hypothetical protein
MPVDNYGMHKSHAEHSAVKFRMSLAPPIPRYGRGTSRDGKGELEGGVGKFIFNTYC